ncbi:MAG TPA: hypothetical protein VMF09_09135 [Solirubrobacteraceae bacterium]|nr:hypothetical protein [Solirubrobacteraceae bacterium]
MPDHNHTDATAGEHATLPPDVQAGWNAFADATKQLASVTGGAESFRAAWDAMAQAASGLDHQQFINAVHIPTDAGQHAEALGEMLARIPDGWGRWISCDRGWYALLIELDSQLRELLPSYAIHQVKEKYGGLRYYWEAGEAIHDPDDPEPSMPRNGSSDAAWASWETTHTAWSERLDAYLQTPEGRRRAAHLKRRVALAEQLVGTFEQHASVTCERCGIAGQLHRTLGRAPWYKTLCPACAEQHGYVLIGASDAS